MKKTYLLFFFLVISFLNAQTKYEIGYYITNSGEKVECLIKNEDWKNSPESITIKKSESDTNTSISTSNLNEFTIYNKKKYKFFSVDIEKSSSHDRQLTYEKEPFFLKENLLLEVLVEGKASLYKYENNGILI